MKKIIAVLIILLFVGSTFGIASVLGASLNIDSKDFQFQSFLTTSGYIGDARTKVTALTDAYDGAFWLFIDNAPYQNPSGSYTTEAGGREYVLGNATLSGLTVSRKVYFPEDRNWVRYLEILKNPTGSPITVEVRVYSNLGSDGSTRVVTTSSGDTIANKNDYWTVSDDGLGTTKYDPSLAFVFDGPKGAKRVDDLYELSDHNDNISYKWKNVTVNPGQTVVLMHFGGLAMNNSDAIALAQGLYNYNDPKMEYDLQEKDLVINWHPYRVASKTLPMQQILNIVKGNQEED